MASNCLLQESVWFDQGRYEEAEARYQQTIAERHSGLKVEGRGISKSGSAISTELEKAMNFIGQSLRAPPQTSKGDLDQRVVALERDNRELKAALAILTVRVTALESGSGQSSSGRGPAVSVSKPEAEEEEDFDLFGSEGEEDQEAEDRVKQERVEACTAKKEKKPKAVAKSSILLDVKTWDDETDTAEMEKAVRSVATDGLVWGASKLVPVAYGIKKLQISCVVEDEKVGTDFLEESITAFEDYVQSVDIVAFNKI